MEAGRVGKILWSTAEAGLGGFPAGAYRVEVEPDPLLVIERVEAARAADDPYAVCFAAWGLGRWGREEVADLFRAAPDLFLVLEGPAEDLPGLDDLGAWARPDHCLTLPLPAPPALRRSLAEHLAARWVQEEADRRRVALLETEARRDRARRRSHEQRLQVLYGIVEKLHGSESLEEALHVALGEMSRFLGATTGSLLLLEGDDRLRVVEAVGPSRQKIRGIEVPLAESRVARHALAEGKPILVEDIRDNDRFHDAADGVRYRPRSFLSVPLFADGVPLGVLNFGGDDPVRRFGPHDERLVVTLGRQVAVAVEKAQLLDGLRRTVTESIRALAGAIEAKDPYTRGHSDRVTHYTRLIAKALGLPPDEVDVVVRAAVLHDVGKIGVPSAVLNKPARLDEDEFRLIQRHPLVGTEIVREIRAMGETLSIIRHHHERVDGRGYPDGLAGEGIPLGARILAVADTFDAMTSDRPYRKGLPNEVAYEEIERCSGTQFDPEVARVFLENAPSWPDLEPVVVPPVEAAAG
ncbi:HD-GYP domain-containing protein [Deferrisoma palaeochoriense]